MHTSPTSPGLPARRPRSGSAPGTAMRVHGGIGSDASAEAGRGPLVLAATLFVAGWIHLVLVPEHLEMATILGAGFALAAAAQLGLAVAVTFGGRPARQPIADAVVVVNVAILVVYAYAVLVGLPFEAAGHDHAGAVMTGVAVGGGEAVDLAGALTAAVELLGIGLAIGQRRASASPSHARR